MSATPPCLIPPAALGTLRKAILTSLAELGEARDEATLALQMRVGGLYVDEAAVIDAVTPILEAVQRDLASTLTELRQHRRTIAHARGEPAAPDNIIPFPTGREPNPGGTAA